MNLRGAPRSRATNRNSLSCGKSSIPVLALLLALLSLGIAQSHAQPPRAQPPTLPYWWTVSDEVFARQNAKLATSDDPVERSAVAWMLFARANQPTAYENMTVTRWELWPSDVDTFHLQSQKAFKAVGKVRNQPHLQISKLAKLRAHDPNTNPDPGKNFNNGTEEVTRNLLSFNYITDNNLYKKAGIAQWLKSNTPVDLPIGVVETKAIWSTTPLPGAYSFAAPHDGAVYYLQSLHIMAKFAKTPQDPFTSTDASWFWTTFEFNKNPGLAHAQSLLLPTKDALPPGEVAKWLGQSGVTAAFPNLANYKCNGTQIRFVEGGKPGLLGNTLQENFGFTPSTASPNDPTQWTKWQISCHTCHGEASAKLDSNGMVVTQPFGNKASPTNIGPIDPSIVNGYKSLDFNWAIDFFAK